MPEARPTRRRVVFLQTSSSGGGSKRSLYEQLLALDSDQRFETSVVCTRRGWFSEQLDRDGRAYDFVSGLEGLPEMNSRLLEEHPLLFSAHLARLSPRLVALWRALRSLHPDCLVLNEARDFPCFFPFFFGRTVIVQNSGVENEGDFWQGRVALRLSHHVFGVSKPVVEHLVRLGKARSRVHLVPPIVDRAPPIPEGGAKRLRAELGIAESEPLVGIVGAVHPRKGQLDLIEAFFSVAIEYPGHVVVAGSVTSSNPEAERYRDALEARVRNHPEGGRVHLLGWREDVSSWFGELDLLAMPSSFEGLPRVALEALSQGVPVAGYDIPSIRAVVAEGTGILTPLGNVSALGGSLRKLLGEPALRRRLGSAGKAHWESTFAPEHLRRITREAFATALEGGGRAA
jgi:glycosyltransferase involved in cell wall biosynthesis